MAKHTQPAQQLHQPWPARTHPLAGVLSIHREQAMDRFYLLQDNLLFIFPLYLVSGKRLLSIRNLNLFPGSFYFFRSFLVYDHTLFLNLYLFYCHNPGLSRVELSNLDRYYYRKIQHHHHHHLCVFII